MIQCIKAMNVNPAEENAEILYVNVHFENNKDYIGIEHYVLGPTGIYVYLKTELLTVLKNDQVL